MKAMYINPIVEINEVQPYVMTQTVSGGNTGLVDGGQDDGTHIPHSPLKPF